MKIKSVARFVPRAEKEPDTDNEVEPYSPKITFTTNIHEHEGSGASIGTWFFKVEVSAFHMRDRVGHFRAFLAKREFIEPSPGDTRKLNFRGALKKAHPDLCILFEEPLRFFNASGKMDDDFEAFASSLFVYDDFKHYRDSTGNDKRGKDFRMHPGYRAWILIIKDIFVDIRYRRRGIGETMVRELLLQVVKMAEKADRPLLVVVQPGFLHEIDINDLIHPEGHRRIHLKAEIAEVFWRSIGFERYEPDAFLGLYHWAWYF